jgi:outer membrane receptor protein involved in Fe transport
MSETGAESRPESDPKLPGRWRLAEAGVAVALLIAALGATPRAASAQTANAAAGTETTAAPATPASGSTQQSLQQSLQAVVITGSRVAKPSEAPTPVTSLSADQLQDAVPSSVVDALSQLPQIQNSSLPQTTGVGTTGTTGQSFLSLRSLGANRTLVLVDGARIVPESLEAETDVSLIPEGLIKRVDIVTGGASAVYGSDAVAGVVNFILDTGYSGAKAEIQGGESQYQDDRNGKAELTVGSDVFGGRGHFVLSGESYKSNGVDQYAGRPWFNSCALIANPALTPTYIPACGAHSAEFTYGGMISTGPLKGTQFGPGGVPMPFNYGTDLTTGEMVGGSGSGGANPDVGAYFQPVPGVKRQSLFGYFDYEITPNVKEYTQLLLAQSDASYNSTYPWEGLGSGYTIQLDNAYLPASIHNAMVADGISSFVLNRYDYDFGPLAVNTSNDTYELKEGIDATWGIWKIDTYYQHGENRFLETTANNPIVNNEYNAADAVLDPATGQVVCRSTLTYPDNDCVPINLFGVGSPSPQALAYVTGTSVSRIYNIEDVASASMSGLPFSLWAGPVSIAFGSGYRREASQQTSDPISSGVKDFTGGYLGFPSSLQGVFGGFDRGNAQPVSGWFNLWEVFGETLVPLAKNLPAVKSLDFNGAVRFTDYSVSGGLASWKAGLTWQVFPSLRFRVAKSRDDRAPNVNELYSGRNQGQGNLIDDFQPLGSPYRNPIVYTVSSGDTDLKPELANTTTFGVVLTPSWLPHFTTSIDRYVINISDAITTLTGQETIDQCYAGATALCSLLTRNSAGVLTSVSTPYLNIGGEDTSGVDLEMDYALPAADIDSHWIGSFAFRALANHTDHLTEIIPGSPNIEFAGETGVAGGVPHWTGDLSAEYEGQPVSVYLQERFIGHGTLNNQYPATELAPMYNYVPAVFYTDATLHYDFGVKGNDWQAYFTVDNLFNRAPPPAPSPYFVFGTSGGGTNESLFDVIGRTYTLGVKLQLW